MSNLMPNEGKTNEREGAQGTEEPEEIAMGQSLSGEGYVRLRVRYENGNLSIVSAKEVAGPLIRPEMLEAGHVYEVRRSSDRINAETIPDLGVQRGFPPPEGEETEEVRGHHISNLTTYEFNVRIPADEFTRQNLDQLQIALYETVGVPEARTLGARPLDVQFEENLRQIGQLKDISLERLPKGVREQIDRALR